MSTTAADSFQLVQFEIAIGIDDHNSLLGFEIWIAEWVGAFSQRTSGLCDLSHTGNKLLAFRRCVLREVERPGQHTGRITGRVHGA